MKRIQSAECFNNCLWQNRVQNLIVLSLFTFIILNSAFLTPVQAAATPTPFPTPCIKTDLTGSAASDCLNNDPGKFTTQIYSIALGFIGGVAVLTIIYGAYLILSSQGNPAQLQKGKEYIMYSIGGVILAISGFVFYEVIAKDILHIPGFG